MDSLLSIFARPEFALKRYAVLAILALMAWAFGRRLTRKVPYGSDFEATLLSTAMGLGAISTALMGLALVGLFRPLWIGIVLAGTQVASWRVWRDEFPKLRHWLGVRRPAGTAAIAILTGVSLSALLLLPLYPPVEFDAVLFHLPFADAIHDAQGVEFFEHLRYPVFPALMEILFALVLTLGDSLMPALVHFLCFVLVALLLFHWSSVRSSPRSGYWAALVWLGTPTAIYAGTSAYVDCGLTLFVTAALFCLGRHWESDRTAWLFAASCFIAFACATKYHALFFVVFAFLPYVAIWTVRRRQPRVAVVALLVAALLVLPWYGHIYLRSGNPIFPFSPRTFGWGPWTYDLKHAPEGRLIDGVFENRTTQETITPIDPDTARFWFRVSRMNLPRLDEHLLDLFLEPEKIGGRPLSPLLLPLLPLALGLAIRSPSARPLFATLLVYFIFWSMTGRDPRYMLPILPIWMLLGTEGLDRLLRWLTPDRWASLGTALGVVLTVPPLAMASLAPAEMVWWNRALPMGEEATRAFVTQRRPAAATIFAYNDLAGDDSSLYGFFAENLRYYSVGLQIGDWFGHNRYATFMVLMGHPPALHQWLSELGVDYLFYPNPQNWRATRVRRFDVPPPTELESHFEAVYADPYATLFRLRAPAEIGSSSLDEAADGGATP